MMAKWKSLGSFLRVFCILCLLALFIQQSIVALLKHMERKTTYHIALMEVKKLLYPSVTVCKKYTFDDYIDHIFEGTSNLSIAEVIQKARRNSWDVERLFYFFTHPGMLGLTFPCTTTLGGTEPGKPCVFPLKWGDNVTYPECFYLSTPSLACVTKADHNMFGYMFEHDFGYCQPNCSGETPEPESPYNLARPSYRRVWTSDFYDLRTYENGLCHTYNPPEPSDSNFLSRLYFMMRNGSEDNYNSWDVFIHEKGQFWPRSDMFSFGQAEVVTVKPGEEVEITFSVEEVENMRTPERSCVESEEHSLTSCLREHIHSHLNCQIAWFQSDSDSHCSPENLERYFQFLIKLKQDQTSDILHQSGCHPKCRRTQFTLQTNRNKIDWAAKWTAAVYLQPRSAVVKHSTEYYSYDFNDLIGDVGGYLGLFLGWSVVTFLDSIPFLLSLVRSKIIKKENNFSV